MRYSAAHKAETHEKILATACRCFRERGIGNVSVADLMAEAGLTHGGFYSHFKSKDALIAEVIRHGLEESRHYLAKWGGGAADGERPLDVIIRNYLSRRHRDNAGTGCPLPALGPEIARSGAAAKIAFDDKLKEIVAVLGEFGAGGVPEAQENAAIAVLSTLVGAMMLARASNDPAYSDRILGAGKTMLAAMLAPRAEKPRSRKRKKPV